MVKNQNHLALTGLWILVMIFGLLPLSIQQGLADELNPGVYL